MTRVSQSAGCRKHAGLMALLCALCAGGAPAQRPAPAAVKAPALNASGTQLDRVVAIVNGELILDSDVNEELRMSSLQPYKQQEVNESTEQMRGDAIERLINRTLILQQLKLQPEVAITSAEVAADLDKLRKALPDCKQYECETEAGWSQYLAGIGFTPATLEDRWHKRMEVLQFIEQRFRAGIRITPDEIQAYYTKTMLPEYKKRGVVPPPLDALSDRIQGFLLEDRVSALQNEWLKSLRTEGSVVVLHPGEDAP